MRQGQDQALIPSWMSPVHQYEEQKEELRDRCQCCHDAGAQNNGAAPTFQRHY
jgi:hypothetical protein